MRLDTLLPIMMSIMVSFNLLEAATVISSIEVDDDGTYKTCLYIANEEDQIFVERNLADFIYSNTQQLKKLEELVDSTNNINPDNMGEVKQTLSEILDSETNIAVQFYKRPKEFIRDLNSYTHRVWDEGYSSKADVVTSVDEIKDMLIILHKIVDLIRTFSTDHAI